MSSIKPERAFTDEWANGIEPRMTTRAQSNMRNNCHIGEA